MCYHYTNTGYFAPAFFWTPVLLVFPSRQRKKKRYMNFAEYQNCPDDSLPFAGCFSAYSTPFYTVAGALLAETHS